ncbi:uncharacterized protein MONOS_4691 [Monocercomonoides exilis]|uniref:uncharacterized protein n=1 Tax=Monocercomonoides exilis TaxID=2049356 RepID=UPI003559A590|nr:hypothetical protein MONOS_4691 [Monocercomonoides exilis]|eukprot:MONOS_4691.1-p1 / transcript=MONOS_4691.1 / gene=MONOS_4691 / organism=Monocercomonoides_exilis_PA203 / gene_product=unspecified product / transcript_product=unspecified product / location=Mono_scaffold00127:91785-92413(-) / protein_length=154 / sequence_SO=supercontig / SO=protein_coding / is_pseudo=false
MELWNEEFGKLTQERRKEDFDGEKMEKRKESIRSEERREEDIWERETIDAVKCVPSIHLMKISKAANRLKAKEKRREVVGSKNFNKEERRMGEDARRIRRIRRSEKVFGDFSAEEKKILIEHLDQFVGAMQKRQRRIELLAAVEGKRLWTMEE